MDWLLHLEMISLSQATAFSWAVGPVPTCNAKCDGNEKNEHFVELGGECPTSFSGGGFPSAIQRRATVHLRSGMSFCPWVLLKSKRALDSAWHTGHSSRREGSSQIMRSQMRQRESILRLQHLHLEKWSEPKSEHQLVSCTCCFRPDTLKCSWANCRMPGPWQEIQDVSKSRSRFLSLHPQPIPQACEGLGSGCSNVKERTFTTCHRFFSPDKQGVYPNFGPNAKNLPKKTANNSKKEDLPTLLHLVHINFRLCCCTSTCNRLLSSR